MFQTVESNDKRSKEVETKIETHNWANMNFLINQIFMLILFC